MENADKHNYQPLIDVFSNNQIVSIERALNWKTVENASSYDNVLNVLETKLFNYRIAEAEKQNIRILQNMNDVFAVMKQELENYKEDLKAKLDKTTEIDNSCFSPDEANSYYYARQIINYANQYDYPVLITVK